MNYKAATNYELNVKLATLLGMEVATPEDAPFNFSSGGLSPSERFENYRSEYPNSTWCLKEGEPWEQYVFTSDWSATMPLFIKYRMHIQECSGLWDCGYSSGGGMFATQNHYVVSDKDPLRAIVICLINILEKGNVQ